MNAPTDSKDVLTISSTASQVGYGSDGYKRVKGLTDEERQQVKSDHRVFFRAERPSQKGPAGTLWRYAISGSGTAMYPRVPSDDEVAALRAATGLV